MIHNFTYAGVPIEVGAALRGLPYVNIPDPESGLTRRIATSLLTIGFEGTIIVRTTDQLLNAQGDVIPRATLPASQEKMLPEDYEYFYNIIVGNESFGAFVAKQIINRILKRIFGVNCFNHLGEFLQPISFTAEVSGGDIVVTLGDFDNNHTAEYSFDGGVTWQAGNTLAAPDPGDYAIVVRYQGVDLREGIPFVSTQEVTINIPTPE